MSPPHATRSFPAQGSTTRTRRKRRPSIGTLIVCTLVGGWALLASAPVLVSVLSSLKTNLGIVLDPLGLPLHPDFHNYIAAAAGTPGGQPITTYLKNSLIATTIGSSIGLTVSVLGGYHLSHQTGRWTTGWTRYYFVLLTLPPVVTLIPLFTLTGELHLRGTPWGLGIVYAAGSVPLSVILLRSFFANFPREIIEAARLDGASEARIFLSIVLPLSRGPIGTVALLQGVSMWNELTLAVVLLSRSSDYTTPVGLLLFHTQYSVDLGAQFAGLMIAALPILIAFAVFNRQFVDGLRVGAVK